MVMIALLKRVLTKDNFKLGLNFLRKTAFDFKVIFWVFLVVLVFSTATYVGSLVKPDLSDVLVVSQRTPWGIVTVLFVHTGAEHLLENMIGLFFYLLLFATTNSFLSEKERSTRIKFILSVVFPVAVLSNLLWVILVPNIGVMGTSGIVYAFAGVTMGFILLNSLELFHIGRNILKSGNTLTKHYLYNLVFLIALLLIIVSETGLFLNISPGVNVFVHGIAFYIAFLLTLLVFIRRSNRRE